jgi:TPR repeat protein
MALQTKSKTQSKSGSNSDLTAKQSFTAAMKYCNGEGVRKDWRRAFSLCQQSAGRGNLDAMDALGVVLHDGVSCMKVSREGLGSLAEFFCWRLGVVARYNR